jgi:hypothetical protein
MWPFKFKKQEKVKAQSQTTRNVPIPMKKLVLLQILFYGRAFGEHERSALTDVAGRIVEGISPGLLSLVAKVKPDGEFRTTFATSFKLGADESSATADRLHANVIIQSSLRTTLQIPPASPKEYEFAIIAYLQGDPGRPLTVVSVAPNHNLVPEQ